MPRLPKQAKTNYSLRRRFFTEIGEPKEWIDFGKGEFKDIETVQDQIKTLASGKKKVEIEFMLNGQLCNYKGEETGKTIIYEKR